MRIRHSRRLTAGLVAGIAVAALAAGAVASQRDGLSVPAMTLMNVGDPHSAVPAGMAAGDFDARVQSQRQARLAHWDNLYSRSVYANMGIGDVHGPVK